MSKFTDERPFYFVLPETVFLDPNLNGTELRVYGLVRSFLDTTGEAFFSNEWAAEKLNTSPKSIQRAISKLVKIGHLRREDDPNTGYRYLSIGNKIRVSDLEGDDKNVMGKRTKMSRGDGQKCPGGMDKNVHQLDQSLLIQNYDLNNNELLVSEKLSTGKELAIKQRSLTKEEVQAMFDKLWQIYPLKKGKITALNALNRLLKPITKLAAKKLMEDIWSALNACINEHAAKQQLKDQGANIFVPNLPHLSTWLNQERWRDDYQQPQDLLRSAKKPQGVLDLDNIL